MKLLVFLFFFLFTLCSFFDANAQEEIKLNSKYENLFDIDKNPDDIDTIKISQGGSFKFISEGEDFGVIIRNANRFLEIETNHLMARANSYILPVTYTVRPEGEVGEYEIEIYCITGNIWADAPPRIIIVTHD